MADLNAGRESYYRGDHAAALEELQPLADDGDPVAKRFVAYLYLGSDDVATDTEAAIELFRSAAEQGDLNRAAELFTRSAELGDPRAQFNLAVCFATGQGTPADWVQAHLWFGLAAAQGHPGGQQALSQIEEGLSAAQITEAQSLAQQWRPRRRDREPGMPDWKWLSGVPNY